MATIEYAADAPAASGLCLDERPSGEIALKIPAEVSLQSPRRRHVEESKYASRIGDNNTRWLVGSCRQKHRRSGHQVLQRGERIAILWQRFPGHVLARRPFKHGQTAIAVGDQEAIAAQSQN